MSNALATTPGTSVAAVERGQSLRQGYDPKDIIFPRVLLLQYTPPKNVEIPEDMFKPGRLLNSLTLTELPKKFVPIAVRTRWIRWNAQEATKPGYDPAFELGAKIWESEDPTDPRVVREGAWGPNNEAPLATKSLEFFCLFEDSEMPMLLTFAKTSFRAGQQLLSLCQLGREMFTFQYELTTKQQTNAQQQKFYVLNVRQAGKTPDDRFAACKSMFDFYARAKDIKVHGDDSSDEEATRPF